LASFTAQCEKVLGLCNQLFGLRDEFLHRGTKHGAMFEQERQGS
jgi:hypothetical protein